MHIHHLLHSLTETGNSSTEAANCDSDLNARSVVAIVIVVSAIEIGEFTERWSKVVQVAEILVTAAAAAAQRAQRARLTALAFLLVFAHAVERWYCWIIVRVFQAPA